MEETRDLYSVRMSLYPLRTQVCKSMKGNTFVDHGYAVNCFRDDVDVIGDLYLIIPFCLRRLDLHSEAFCSYQTTIAGRVGQTPSSQTKYELWKRICRSTNQGSSSPLVPRHTPLQPPMMSTPTSTTMPPLPANTLTIPPIFRARQNSSL